MSWSNKETENVYSFLKDNPHFDYILQQILKKSGLDYSELIRHLAFGVFYTLPFQKKNSIIYIG